MSYIYLYRDLSSVERVKMEVSELITKKKPGGNIATHQISKHVESKFEGMVSPVVFCDGVIVVFPDFSLGSLLPRVLVDPPMPCLPCLPLCVQQEGAESSVKQ